MNARGDIPAAFAGLAALVAFAAASVTACTDEPETLMVLEVTTTDEGILGLTKASADRLEEAVLSAGGLDKPLRLRVSAPDGAVLREVAADSYHDLLTTVVQEGMFNVGALEKEMEGLLAAMASGELDVDLSAWRDAAEEFQSAFGLLDSLRFIDAERKKNATVNK
jgi:hypothetical protein